MPDGPALPSNENKRLAALRAYHILDTEPEESFDRITALAAQLCDAPIALVSLVDDCRQWFKSHFGLDATETPRDMALCAHAILDKKPFVVASAATDPRFLNNPLVTGKPGIKSYAGAPLITANGFQLGTLCVIHTSEEVQLSRQQISQLEELAAITVRELDFRVALKAAQDAQAEAQAADAAKSQFLAAMSHEIRTPMNGVLGMANMLSRTELTAEQRDYLAAIKESGDSLLVMLNDVLDLSKIEAGRIELEPQDFQVAGLIKSAEDFWGPQAREKDIKLTVRNHMDHDTYIRADRGRLRQILNNLIGNAVKFTADGRIEIGVEEIPNPNNKPDGQIEIRFEIRDTGIGLSEEQVAKLFEPFSQADKSITRKYGGTGLGLSICKCLVELLDGDIGVRSTPGMGSTFWFTAKAARGEPAAAMANEAKTEHVVPGTLDPNRTLRILVAEDNRINRQVVGWMLEPLDAQIDMVENGLEAVAAVARSPYDLVLMDIQMPEMDGVTATQKIRAMADQAASLPIIALTANAMQGDREAGLAAGMSGYVAKPIDQRDLLNTITGFAGVAMPDMAESARPAAAPQNYPPAPETSRKVKDLAAELDNLLDGTHC